MSTYIEMKSHLGSRVGAGRALPSPLTLLVCDIEIAIPINENINHSANGTSIAAIFIVFPILDISVAKSAYGNTKLNIGFNLHQS